MSAEKAHRSPDRIYCIMKETTLVFIPARVQDTDPLFRKKDWKQAQDA